MGISGEEYDEIRNVVGDSHAFSSRGLISSGANPFKKIFSAIKNSRPTKFLFGNNTEAYGHPLCIVKSGEKNYNRHLKRLRREVRSMSLGDETYNNYGANQYPASSRSRGFPQNSKVVCVLMFNHPVDLTPTPQAPQCVCE